MQPESAQQAVRQQQQGEPRSTTCIYPVKREPGETKYKTFYSEAAQSEVSYLLYLPTD